VRRRLVLAGALAVAALALAPTAGATNECRGLNPCVPVAGPWVVVPTGKSIPLPEVQWQLTCPRGFVVAGLDAELSDRAIDVTFLGASGAPVSPGITTSRTVVFVGTYTGTSPRAPTFKPHAGCVPSSGGGSRTPTGLAAVFPPGTPTVRRATTAGVTSTRRIVAACRAGERLVAWYSARGFDTTAAPLPGLVASLSTRVGLSGNRVVALAHARRGQGVVQVAAVCAGGA
jgi:hypothetical protein